jgi:hypothetical protein
MGCGKPWLGHTDDDIIQRMRISWRITKATDTDSEYLIFIALPQLQR